MKTSFFPLAWLISFAVVISHAEGPTSNSSGTSKGIPKFELGKYVLVSLTEHPVVHQTVREVRVVKEDGGTFLMVENEKSRFSVRYVPAGFIMVRDSEIASKRYPGVRHEVYTGSLASHVTEGHFEGLFSSIYSPEGSESKFGRNGRVYTGKFVLKRLSSE